MTGRRRDLDEDDIRIRPGKQKSRARSKVRPSHGDASPGMVVAVDRGRLLWPGRRRFDDLRCQGA